MNPSSLRSLCLLVTAATALAQTPGKPTTPPKPKSDSERLQEAIDAVDRKNDPAAKKPGAPAAEDKPAKEQPKPAPKPGGSPSAGGKDKPKTGESGNTVILHDGAVLFDSKKGHANYETNVLVDRDDLKIWCDTLEVWTEGEGASKPKAKPNDADAVKSAPKSGEGGSSQIKTGIAKANPGKVVTIWRKTDEGDVVAIAAEAVYTGSTGNIVLKGRSELIKELKLHVVSNDGMTLTKSGQVGYQKGSTNLINSVTEGKVVRDRLIGPVLKLRRTSVTPGANTPPVTPAPAPATPTSSTPTTTPGQH